MAKTKEKSKKKHSKSKDEVKEKKISKKHKSKSKSKSEEPEKKHKSEKKHKNSEKPEKSEKKSKKSEGKHKKSEKSEVPEPQIAHRDASPPTRTPVATRQSDSDTEYDTEDLRQLLESYSKEHLVDLICTTAQKGSRLISTVFESADRDVSHRRIFVHNLAWDMTREKLEDALQPYGEIEDCQVIMDKATGRAKGYAFVLFKTRKGAREALKNPFKKLGNRTMMCNLALKGSAGAGKGREMVESVKIDLPKMANVNQGQVPGYVPENGHYQHPGSIMTGQSMPIVGHPGQSMPIVGHPGQSTPLVGHPSGFYPIYGGLMGNPAALAGVPNYAAFGSGVMSNGLFVPPNHVDMAGQHGVVGVGGGGEIAWPPR